jgi:hypothetical protein
MTPRENDDPNGETNPEPPKFNFATYPRNSLFHERRSGRDRRDQRAGQDGDASRSTAPLPIDRRARTERRRRIDPTTFEKQYTVDELEFMNAMQRFKVQSCTAFPSYAEVLKVAFELGYRKVVSADDPSPPALDAHRSDRVVRVDGTDGTDAINELGGVISAQRLVIPAA